MLKIKNELYNIEELRKLIIEFAPELATFFNTAIGTGPRHFLRLFPETKGFTEKSYMQKLLKLKGMRYCKGCKTTLGLSNFYQSTGRNCANPKCKQCEALVGKIWEQNNRGLRNSYTNKRRAAKIQRTPSWADAPKIEAIYKKCPKDMEVDHIIPLQGTLVSGLHVAENLQILERTINRKKGNNFCVF